MSTNMNSIPTAVVEQKMEGLRREDGALADELCDTRTVDTKDGTFTVVNTKNNIARSEDKGLIEIGARPDMQDDEVTSESYHLKKAAMGERIQPEIIESIDNTAGRSELERKMRKARNSANAKIDAALQSELTDSNKNTEIDVTGQNSANGWDGSGADIFSDFEYGFDQVPGADTLFIGRDDQKKIKQDSDFLAESGMSFDAGMLDPREVNRIFRQKFPSLDTVIVGDVFFSDQNEEGLSLNLGYELSGTTWLGYQRACILFEWSSRSPATRMSDRDTLSGSQTFVFERLVDVLRPSTLSDLGAYFINT